MKKVKKKQKVATIAMIIAASSMMMSGCKVNNVHLKKAGEALEATGQSTVDTFAGLYGFVEEKVSDTINGEKKPKDPKKKLPQQTANNTLEKK